LINETQPVTTPERKPIWGGWPTIGLGAAILAIYLFAQTIVTIAFVIGKIISSSGNIDPQSILNLASNGDVITLATICSTVFGTAFILLFVKIRKGPPIRDYLGLTRLSKKVLLISLAVIIALMVISFMLDQFMSTTQDSAFLIDAYKTSTWPVLLWISVVVFAPVFEEGFFRGFIFVGLQQTRLGAAGTIAITAAAWALLHLQYSLYGMATILVLGVVFGMVRYKSNSLWSTILLHALWNLIAMIGTAIQ
jgi:uncharacterized protein